MKKFVSVLLVIAVFMSLGVSALAGGSPVVRDRTGDNNGIVIYDENDKAIAYVPESKVIRATIGTADKLSEKDKEAFLAASDEVKNIEDKVVRRFLWLDIPEEYKNLENFAYAKYEFGSMGQNVYLTANGNKMDVVKLGSGRYFAKLTEFGSLAIISD